MSQKTNATDFGVSFGVGESEKSVHMAYLSNGGFIGVKWGVYQLKNAIFKNNFWG